MSLGTKEGLAMPRWMLSSTLLEVEVGIYTHTPREKRFCRKFYLVTGTHLIGDEKHAPTECVRAAEVKEKTRKHMKDILNENGISLQAGPTQSILEMTCAIKDIPKRHQTTMWQHLGKTMVAIDNALKQEQEEEYVIPNKWKQLMLATQTKTLLNETEKHFRKSS